MKLGWTNRHGFSIKSRFPSTNERKANDMCKQINYVRKRKKQKAMRERKKDS